MEWLGSWSPAAWGNLASRILLEKGKVGRVLLDRTMHAAHGIAAFVQQEVFYLSVCHPWPLLQGDIAAKQQGVARWSGWHRCNDLEGATACQAGLEQLRAVDWDSAPQGEFLDRDGHRAAARAREDGAEAPP